MQREQDPQAAANRITLDLGELDAKNPTEGGDHAPGLTRVVPGQIDGAREDEILDDFVAGETYCRDSEEA